MQMIFVKGVVQMATVLITGGTGFIGSAMVRGLQQEGHTLLVITRNPQRMKPSERVFYLAWPADPQTIEREFGNIDIIINLAGDPINKGRWTDAKKRSILDSRVNMTRKVTDAIHAFRQKPSVLINASAIGYYGFSETTVFRETDQVTGDHFLTKISEVWEQEAMRAEQDGVRVVLARFGIVLGRDGGALAPMVMPYRLFGGGTVASGKQWLSWIHIDDVVGLAKHIIRTESLRGPVNFTAPQPLQMKPFGQAIGKVLGRPHWLPVPTFALRFMFGEMSDLLTKGQHVIPQKALDSGYTFRYDTAEAALADLLAR